jgi:hypothetical protein
MNQINLKKTMKAKTASPKLIDILSVSKETNEQESMLTQVSQAHINTQQEILDLKGQLNKQKAVISAALQNNPFSATKLYVARKEEALLELKLKALQEILEELF